MGWRLFGEACMVLVRRIVTWSLSGWSDRGSESMNVYLIWETAAPTQRTFNYFGGRGLQINGYPIDLGGRGSKSNEYAIDLRGRGSKSMNIQLIWEAGAPNQ